MSAPHDIKIITEGELSPAGLQGDIFHSRIRRTNTSALQASSTKLLAAGEKSLQFNNMPIGM